jgi:PAS domain S-box-containing protein
MRHFGMAKIYTLSRRLPVSSVLSISSEYVMQLDSSLRIIFLNQPFLDRLGVKEKEIVGQNIEFSPLVPFFDDVFPSIIAWIHDGLSGTEFRSEVEVSRQALFFFCRIAPTVFNNGQKGVSVLFEDITQRKQNEARISESEARLRSLISVAPIGIGILSNRVIFEVNELVSHMTGYEAAELIGQSTRKLYITQDDFDRAGEIHYRNTPRTGEGSIEMRWKRKDGSLIDVLLSSTPLSPEVLADGFMFAVLDITERKRTEEALRESQEKFRSFIENANDIIYSLTPDGEFTYVSPMWIELLGHDTSEVLGTHIPDFIHPDDLPRCYKFLRQVLATGKKMGGIEYRIRHKNGTWQWHTTTGSPLCDAKGKIISFLGICHDITERKISEEELWKSRQLLAKAMDIACMANWEFDSRTGMFTFDDRFYALYGTTTEREGGSQMSIEDYVREFVHPDDRDIITSVVEKVRQVTDPRSMIQVEHRIIRRDGAVRHIVVRIGVITDDDGRPIKSFGANQDITDRKNIEEALRQSEEKFRTLVETSSDFIWEVDDHAVYTYISPKIRDILGYDPKEVVGKTPFDLMPPDEAARVAAEFNRFMVERQPFAAIENTNLHKNGITVILETSGVPWFYKDGTFAGYRGVDRNITARKQAESALRESEARYRSLAEVSQDMIFVISGDDRVLYINQQAADFIRKPADAVIGQPRSALFSPDVTDHQNKALQYVFRTGLPVRSEGSMMVYDEVRWFDHALVPIPGPDGKVASVMGVSRDITKRIAAEEEQRQNEQNNRFIAEHSVDIIIRSSPENICTYVSPAIAKVLGYTEQEILGRSLVDFMHPDDVPNVMKEVELIHSSGQETATTIFRIRHKAGHYLRFESTTRIVRDEAGRIREYLSISRDITGRTRAGS